MTREVISHFLFFSERILGPLSLVWARPSYPSDPQLCETHMLARLENADGVPVTVMASVGGARPSGTSFILEDVCFPPERLADGALAIQDLLARHGEKFFDLTGHFGPGHVGLMTGDSTINREAPIVCCTAEILSNMALHEGASTPVDAVVMDEFHYYADRDRGWAWQVPLVTAVGLALGVGIDSLLNYWLATER